MIQHEQPSWYGRKPDRAVPLTDEWIRTMIRSRQITVNEHESRAVRLAVILGWAVVVIVGGMMLAFWSVR